VLLIHKFNFEFISIGFYRVNYDENNWNLLINYLESEDYEKIPPVNRAQLLDDALNLARAGVLNYSTALNLTQYLEKEVDYIPWYSALSAFSFLTLRLTGTEISPAFKVIQGA
jgi:aminopeptidase N